jgi:DNA-binding transcriptional ArsR family regulator
MSARLFDEIEFNPELAMLLVSPPIAFNPAFVDIAGSVTAALLLSVCTQESEHMDEQGWFSLSFDRIHAISRMTKSEHRSARKSLIDAGLIEVRRSGYPAATMYKINPEILTKKLIELSTRSREVAAEKAVH